MPKQLPYGRQEIDAGDLRAVREVLESDWLTTGPKVDEFEAAFARFVGAAHAVAVCNGTAALHAATSAAGISEADEVLLPSLTFVATANSVVYQGGVPVFCEVDPESWLLDVEDVARRIGPRTKAILAVDYAGQACDYDALTRLAEAHGLRLITDACHALGATYGGRRVGSLASLSTFSFHPVKHMTTCEGGMITTDDGAAAAHMRAFRNHGLQSDHRQRQRAGTWVYAMNDLGYNYRLSDLQSALGISQLQRVPRWLGRRRALAAQYDDLLRDLPGLRRQELGPQREHAYHLYVVHVDPGVLGVDRAALFSGLRRLGVGVNVHYEPVHLQPFYRERFGYAPGSLPRTERLTAGLLTLPLFPAMTDSDVQHVVDCVRQVVAERN